VLHLDIDQLLHVDTTCGHSTRDAVLRTVAERLKDLTRSCDTAAQLDDGTFAVVLLHLPAGLDVHALVHRENAPEPTTCTPHGPLTVTFSIGAAFANPANRQDDCDPHRVLQRAEGHSKWTKTRRPTPGPQGRTA
jgi:two-component system, sensor histidine kinase LadS